MGIPNAFTLRSLSKLTGIEPRTIRSYIEKGLVPGAAKRGRHARYGLGHLERLQFIQRLREKGDVPLDEIRRLLLSLGEGRIREVASGEEEVAALLREQVVSGEPVTALDYLRAIRAGRVERILPESAAASPAQERLRFEAPGLPLESGAAAAKNSDLTAWRSAPCERCGAPMRLAQGRRGEFLACSTHPQCRNTRSLLPRPPGVSRWARERAAKEHATWGAPILSEPAPREPARLERVASSLEQFAGRKAARRARGEAWWVVPVTPDIEIRARGLDGDDLARMERIADYLRHLLQMEGGTS